MKRGMYKGCANMEQTYPCHLHQFQNIAQAISVRAQDRLFWLEEIRDCRCMNHVINALCKLIECITAQTKPTLRDVTRQANNVGSSERRSVHQTDDGIVR